MKLSKNLVKEILLSNGVNAATAAESIIGARLAAFKKKRKLNSSLQAVECGEGIQLLLPLRVWSVNSSSQLLDTHLKRRKRLFQLIYLAMQLQRKRKY